MGVMLMAGERLSTRKFQQVNNWLLRVHDWLLPASCVLCSRAGVGGRDLCSGCAAELPYMKSSCVRCAIPLPQLGTCGRCQQSAPSFDSAYATFSYQPPIAQLIQGLKFNGRLYNARLLGELMVENLSSQRVELPDVLVPVPLHAARLRERGFNQALELARPIAKNLAVPLVAGCCRRVRSTSAQTGLDAKARRRNLRDAFELVRHVNGTHVAIVDDVMTTGSTVEVLASTLKQAGVKRVDVWLCARAALRGQ